jgi:hypothetical protein
MLGLRRSISKHLKLVQLRKSYLLGRANLVSNRLPLQNDLAAEALHALVMRRLNKFRMHMNILLATGFVPCVRRLVL